MPNPNNVATLLVVRAIAVQQHANSRASKRACEAEGDDLCAEWHEAEANICGQFVCEIDRLIAEAEKERTT